MNAAIKFIVWDWNGTLIEDTPLNVACFNRILSHSGKKKIDTHGYQSTFEVPIEKLYFNNGFSEEEVARDKIAHQNLYHDAYDEGILSVGFRKDAREILQETHQRNIRHIILSNHLVPSIEDHLHRLNAKSFFWNILAHENRETQRGWHPKGERLKTLMRDHGLRPENGIVVGDTPEETHIARETGLTSIAITGGFATKERLREAKPDHLIDALQDMNPILRKRGFVS